MCTTKVSPTCRTGSPSADWSMPELSMATCPRGSASSAKITPGVAAIWRWTSNRSGAPSGRWLFMDPILSGQGAQATGAGVFHGQVVALLDLRRLAGPAAVAVEQDLAALVGRSEER